jgi:hypothetical protein
MKYLYILLFVLFVCCSENKQRESKSSVDESILPVKSKVALSKPTPFPKYATAYASHIPSYEDTATCEGGCASDYVKLLSKPSEPEHLLILTEGKGSAKQLKAETKLHIIATIFRAFAETDINEITISSVPMIGKEKYREKYRLTATASRNKAKTILEKYLHTKTFRDLYYFDEYYHMWDSNQKFDSLMTVYADSVFAELKR